MESAQYPTLSNHTFALLCDIKNLQFSRSIITSNLETNPVLESRVDRVATPGHM